MSDRSIELTRRRLLGGILAVGGGSAASGAGTMAYFSDTETSQNQIRAGTLAVDFQDPANASFSMTLAPEQSQTHTLTLVNAGTVTGSLDVDVEYNENDGATGSADMTADEVAQNLEITTLNYNSTDVRTQISPSSSPPTLAELASNGIGESPPPENDLIDLGDPGGGTDFEIEFTLKNVSDDYQGDGVDVTFEFYLNQNDSM